MAAVPSLLAVCGGGRGAGRQQLIKYIKEQHIWVNMLLLVVQP